MIQLYLKELSRVQDELIDPRALFKELHVCYYLEQKRTVSVSYKQLFFLVLKAYLKKLSIRGLLVLLVGSFSDDLQQMKGRHCKCFRVTTCVKGFSC